MAILKSIKSLFGALAALSCAMLFTGCYTEYPLDVDAKPVLCINSLTTAGEPIEVSVSRTWVYTDMEAEDNHTVTDATVTIYANGQQVQEDYRPKEGDEIRVHAASRLYGEAEAKVRVPKAPLLNDLEYTPVEGLRWGYKTENGMYCIDLQFNLHLRVSIDDLPGVDNYYLYEMEDYVDMDDAIGEDSYFSIGCGNLDYEAEPIFGEHISGIDIVNGATPDEFSFFTDRQFSGKDYRLNLRYTGCRVSFRGLAEEVEEFCNAGFEIILSSISESYYKWNYYCWQYYEGSIFDFVDSGLTDQIPAYSNVSTGAGVVAARSTAKVRVPLDEFLSEQLKDVIKKLEERE
ncbi:MAG: DUF4249 domain-containing protein [Muribaculaceae bacterium]|nr:DUF4249 domain-containing protein [Muribaculaceae bacterium]